MLAALGCKPDVVALGLHMRRLRQSLKEAKAVAPEPAEANAVAPEPAEAETVALYVAPEPADVPLGEWLAKEAVRAKKRQSLLVRKAAPPKKPRMTLRSGQTLRKPPLVVQPSLPPCPPPRHVLEAAILATKAKLTALRGVIVSYLTHALI